MKRAVLYTRVSTFDQNPETQALDLRRLAEQRGFEIVHEYPTGSAAPRLSAPHSTRCLPLPTAGSSTRCWCGRLTD
jgi:hypothetical protein